MRQYICNCINPIWDNKILNKIIENGKEIDFKTFINECEVEDSLLKTMKKYPHDFKFFKYKDIYFFEHSRIEYFFR